MAAVRAAAAEAKPREGNQGGDVEGGVRRVEMLFGGSSFVCGLLQNWIKAAIGWEKGSLGGSTFATTLK
jgi:hypothetical protein